jgi:hypothetical protein
MQARVLMCHAAAMLLLCESSFDVVAVREVVCLALPTALTALLLLVQQLCDSSSAS